MNQMSSLSTPRILPPSLARGVALSARSAAAIVAVLAVLGVTFIPYAAWSLWALWTTDPLKSIGMVIAPISFLLILRVWRSLNWEMDGTWWGLALLVGIALLSKIREQSVMEMFLGPWTINFPPHSIVVLAYGIGLVLLFGGVRLLRAAWFPVVLLLLVNPVPHLFNVYVDLPLQQLSAHVARGFAMSMGQPLTPDKLRLMFTPAFGMFIAPGCNGIRGSVTMGLIALVAGYLYRFRWRAHVLVVLAAILLGYVFNLARLCVLVLYYIVALHIPRLQEQAENADYVIGGVLFFIAVYLLYSTIQRLGSKEIDPEAGVTMLPRSGDALPVNRSFYLRAAAMLVLVLLGCAEVVQAMTAPGVKAEFMTDSAALGPFPQTIGNYTLLRRWNETLITGALLFHWAEYAPADGGTHISIGISPVLGSHDTLVCHTARGEDPLWHQQETIATGGGESVNFNAAFFNDGATQYMEATTLCNGTSCGEYATGHPRFGFMYSKPHAASLLEQSPQRPIPILLRAETIDMTLTGDEARRDLQGNLAQFLSAIRLDELTQPYRR